MGHWFGGVVDAENPDGSYTVAIQAAGNVHYSKLTRDTIRRAGESVEDAEQACERHDKRRLEDKVLAKWMDGKWKLGFLVGLNENGTYAIYWVHNEQISDNVARANIKFKRQIEAEENADTYTLFWRTGNAKLFPGWESRAGRGGGQSDFQRKIIKGEAMFKRLQKEMKEKGTDIGRRDYWLLEEEEWDLPKLRKGLNLPHAMLDASEKVTDLSDEKTNSAPHSSQPYDVSNPRAWSEEALTAWVNDTFKKPKIVKNLGRYARQVPATEFFTNVQKPAELKRIGIGMKSMHRKIEEGLKGLNLRVW